MEVSYKVEINPSYEWDERAKSLGISHRELEVFALVTEGYNNKKVAQILNIKHQSVKNHMHHFNKKLNVKNNTQALIIAVHLNLIKVRAKTPYKDLPVIEINDEDFINNFRKLIAGETWSREVKEKQIRYLKVFLEEHEIDPYNW
jgi:DNA-binding CsgD family transcriptional regulator